MSDIKSVCSHPHALPQCSAFISEHGFTAIEMANTAIAAQSVRDKGDPSLAAICSREAAERYGLTVLAEGINDMKHNETRFIAVSRTPTCLPEDNRIEIAFRIPNVAGSLITVLDIIAHYGVDMTEIHSRPLKDSPWCYVFYVDFTGNINDHAVRSLLYQLHEELPYIKVIGSGRLSRKSTVFHLYPTRRSILPCKSNPAVRCTVRSPYRATNPSRTAPSCWAHWQTAPPTSPAF